MRTHLALTVSLLPGLIKLTIESSDPYDENRGTKERQRNADTWKVLERTEEDPLKWTKSDPLNMDLRPQKDDFQVGAHDDDGREVCCSSKVSLMLK